MMDEKDINPNENNEQQDDSDADAFAILAVLAIIFATVVYYLNG